MHTVSFFSFKGGVGRTNLLLNIAYGLAQRGDFVVIADWDLHAPGFSLNPLFFRPLQEPKIDNDIRPGVLDFLDSALDPDQQSTIIDPKTLAQPTRLGQADRAAGRFNDTGDIWSIPAGRFDPQSDVHEYDKQLRRVQGRNLADWLIRYEEQNNENGTINSPHALLQFFRERIQDIRHPETDKAPDWLLIDSRTGMTEIGDLLLHTEFIDRMVLVSGFNEQNLAGIESVIRAIQQKTRPGELRNQLSLVFSPVPQSEEQLKQQRLNIIKKRLDSLAREQEDKLEPFPQMLTVPYHPRIALQEEIMLRKFPDSTLTPSYQEVIDELTDKAKKQIDELLALGSDDTKQGATTNTPSTIKKTDNLLDILSRMGLPWNQIITQLEEDEHWEMAEQAYRRAIKQNPNDVESWNGMGNLLANHLQRYDEAEQAFREAIQRDDKWAYPLNNLGNLLAFHLQRYDEAEQAFREAIQRDDKWAYPWYGLGSLLKNHLQRYDEAEQAYREAIQRDDKDAYPWNGLGNLFIRQERYIEAEQAFRRAIALSEEKASFYLVLAELGLLTDNHALTQEGLDNAKNSAQTNEDQITLALMQLAYAIQQQDLFATDAAHTALLEHKATDQIDLNWNFDDQVPFIERLSTSSANLYQTWLDVFSKDAQKRQQADPQTAFDAWRASAEQA